MDSPKKIQDYLNFYCGQQIMITGILQPKTMRCFMPGSGTHKGTVFVEVAPEKHEAYNLNQAEVKLVLIPIEKYVPTEHWPLPLPRIFSFGINNLIFPETLQMDISAVSEFLNALRGYGFDCDGLIPAGLAIDKTTWKSQTT